LSAQILYVFYGAVYSNGPYNKWRQKKKERKKGKKKAAEILFRSQTSTANRPGA